jgi:tetratricopeptide (TPR) repeat protein
MSRRRRSTALSASAAPRSAVGAVSSSPLADGTPAAGPIGVKFAALLIVVGVAIAYADSLPNDWVYDDRHDILGNPGVVHPWPVWAAAVGWRNGHVELHSRPVVVTTFAWNYALGKLLGGPQPWMFRLVNIGIHALAALTLFGLVRRSLLLPRCAPFAAAATSLALVIALVWGLHPINTQAVSYVTQRFESLMSLFYLLTLYCALRGLTAAEHGGWWKLASVGACALAMGSKEVAVTAPLLVLLYDRTLVSGAFGLAIAQSWKMYAGFAALWPVFALLYWSASGRGFAGFALPIPWWQYLLSESGVILYYLRLSLVPTGQCFDYCWPLAHSFSDVALPFLTVTALFLLTAWGVIRNSTAALLGASFFLVLSVTSSVMPISDLAIEYRMYLALAPVVALVVLGAFWLVVCYGERVSEQKGLLPRLLTALAVLAILLMGAQTALRNRVYENSLTLWQDALEKAPHNPRAMYAVALAIHDQSTIELGKTSPEFDQQALPYVEKAIKANPLDAEAHGLHGILLEELGRQPEAEQAYREALRLGKKYADNWNNLANFLSRTGRATEAEPLYDEALRIDDQIASNYGNRAANFMKLQKLPEAQRDLERAIELDNSHPQWYFMLVTTIFLQGNSDEAIRFALHDYPPQMREIDYYLLLGAIYTKQEKFADAEAAYRTGIRNTSPNDPKAQAAKLGLADTFTKQGRTADSLKILQPMLAAAPEDASVLTGIGLALAKAGEHEQAAEKFRAALRLKPGMERARAGLAELGLQP